MDSGEINKLVGAGVGALLAYMLLGFAADQLYLPPAHHGDDHVLAYALEIEEEAPAAEEAEVDYAALVAAADPSAGEKVYAKCKSCHAMAPGEHGTGPSLHGVVGRPIGAADGYEYSDALAGHGGAWDLASLDGFLANPKGWAPGTKMGFAGIKSAEERVALIVWLNEQGGAPIELAAAPTETATDAAPAEAAAPAEEAAPEAEAATPAPAETPAVTEAPATAPATAQAPAAETPIAETPAAETPAAEAPAVVAAAPAPAAAATPAAGGVAALLASATAADGEKVFKKCRACHKVEQGANGVGPSLWGVVGAPVAAVAGYSYSDALKAKGGAWTVEALDAWLAAPKAWAPGTKMAYAGLKDPAERAALIVYLNEADGSPAPLP